MSEDGVAFANAEAWEAWLAEHHADADGIWVKFAKKASGIPTVVYAEAVHAALSTAGSTAIPSASTTTGTSSASRRGGRAAAGRRSTARRRRR